MKKIRGHEPIGVTIYLYMEISQGNSLCSYLYLKQAKMSFFSFIFSFFLLQKSENRRAELVLPRGGGVWTTGWVQGVGGWIWYKKCVHMYVNAKMILVETVPGIRERRWRRVVEGVYSSTMYLTHCKNLCKCHSVPPPSTIIKKKKRMNVQW
jgi:hypothetical protein